jgi:hypothetical protein
MVQRAARDHFGSIADELHRSLSEAVLAAKQAAGSFSANQDQRVKQLQTQIAQIEAVRAKIPNVPAIKQLETSRR